MRTLLSRGFSLIELILTMTLVALLLGPIWTIFHSGTKTALKGMLSLETTLEARRILRQLHTELKNSCCELSDDGPFLDFSRMYKVEGTALEPRFTFSCFSQHGSIEPDIVQKTPFSEEAPRLVSRVSYLIEGGRSIDKPFSTLKRTERFHPDSPLGRTFPEGKTSILSERVNYFEIKPFHISWKGQEAFYFWIHLRIVDFIKPTAQERAEAQAGKMLQRSANVVMADFYDVVSSDFFMGLWNYRGIHRNWYNPLRGPPGW